MRAASIETTLKLWASELREAKRRLRPLFTQARVAASAGLFLDGLLGPERRKIGSSACAAAPGLDACRGGGRPRSLEAAGDPGARALGGG